MKIEGHGQAKILTQQEIELLFNEGLQSDRDRALFGVCLYTACRIAEACSLKVIDVFTPAGVIRSEMIIRKGNTKGKLGTRTIPLIQELRLLLETYKHPSHPYLFPSRHLNHRWKHANPEAASHLFQEACERVGIIGASTHSLRRSALTQMSNAGIPLRIIQEISGHRNLEQLQKYLEVRPDQVRGAVSALSTLSYVRKRLILIQLPQAHKIRCPLTNCHKAKQTPRPKKFRTGDRLTAKKTDAPAESAGYEMLYHPFNSSHTVPEARSAAFRTIGLRHHLKPRVEQLTSPSKFFKT